MITKRFALGTEPQLPPPQLGGIRAWLSRLVASVQFRIPDFDECRDSMDDMDFGEPCRDCGEWRCRCYPGEGRRDG